MAWRLDFAGNSDYLEASALQTTIADEPITFDVAFDDFTNGNHDFYLAGQAANRGNCYIKLTKTDTNITITQFSLDVTNIACSYTTSSLRVTITVGLSTSPIAATLIVDGTTVFADTSVFDSRMLGSRFNASYPNRSKPIRLYSIVKSGHSWSPDDSDHSGSTDQPSVVDTVGGENLVGVGFPSFDAGVWVNLGGGELNITVPLIEGTPEVFAPTVTLEQFVDLPLIISEELTYPPTIQLGGQLLELDIVPSETEVLTLTLLQELQLELPVLLGETFVHKPMITGGEPVVVISNFIAPLVGDMVKPLISRISA